MYYQTHIQLIRVFLTYIILNLDIKYATRNDKMNKLNKF